jgi:hypothetical protein
MVLDVTRAVPVDALPCALEVTLAVEAFDRSARSKLPAPDTLAVEAADRLARLEGFAPETLALELAARFERSAEVVVFFTAR